MVDAGLPDFGPVQNNIAFNGAVGTTRGIHAEPWDKWVSVATGRIFGAWVDLRAGAGFGTVVTAEIDPSRAVFVPRGVGNAYQTLDPATAYCYLVNDHWSPDDSYTFLNLADETVAIPWPIELDAAEVSDKDRAHPRLADVTPVAPLRVLVLGADGQLGRALRAEFGDDPRFEFARHGEVDVTDPGLAGSRRWRDYQAIVNAAAYTAVDTAETADGRLAAWDVNVTGVAALARIATEHGLTLVHVSSDYVFDGTSDRPYREHDPVCPLGVYGQTKAAADAVVGAVPRHYIVRTSWVVGDGHNFVRTMASLAARGVNPSVVNDQIGRPTFTLNLAQAIRHLLEGSAPFGTYHVTGGGKPASWYDIARAVFEALGADPSRVTGVSTEDYYATAGAAADAAGPAAPRPRNSVLDLSEIQGTGFAIEPWRESLDRFLTQDDVGHG
jgi:dTDP-4-dehydrorhamnose 3,5-epimerase